jgi:hypothetical protein
MAISENKTRQTITQDPTNPKDHLNTGYEDSPAESFSLPRCGIEDVDVSLFKLFNIDIGFRDKSFYSGDRTVAIQKPLVIFATGEKFALAKKLRPPRDKQNKKLLLPAISIRRTSITQTSDDISNRGMNQNTGVITIKRRLDSSDKDYQNFINKMAFNNMDLPESGRTQGESVNNIDLSNGALLTPDLGNNIFEIITIPQPQFFTAIYEVIFWTNYAQHMNYLIETYISSFLPQTRAHKLTSDKGYWFLAYTDDTTTSQENFDDFSEEERIVKYTFNITVKGYILATDYETNQVPVRRYISSPIITFDSFSNENPMPKSRLDEQVFETKNKFVLNDINQDPTTAQVPSTNKKYVYNKTIVKNGKKTKKTVTALETGQKKGETIYYASDRTTLEEFLKSL